MSDNEPLAPDWVQELAKANGIRFGVTVSQWEVLTRSFGPQPYSNPEYHEYMAEIKRALKYAVKKGLLEKTPEGRYRLPRKSAGGEWLH